jgi:pheromone shutdown protein TraB
MVWLQVARTLLPEVTEVLIDSRDKAIGSKLRSFSASDTAERKDYDDDGSLGGPIVAVLGITQLDGVQAEFFSNYIDSDGMWEDVGGEVGAKAHSNLFGTAPAEDKDKADKEGSAGPSGWRRMLGIN